MEGNWTSLPGNAAVTNCFLFLSLLSVHIPHFSPRSTSKSIDDLKDNMQAGYKIPHSYQTSHQTQLKFDGRNTFRTHQRILRKMKLPILCVVFLLLELASGQTSGGEVLIRKKRNTGWTWPVSNSENKGKEERKVAIGKQDQAESRRGFTFGVSSTTYPIITTSTTPRPTTTTTTRPPTTVRTNCTCVPYYYCDEGQINVLTDGKGVIDIRHGYQCPSILQVCCRSPKPIPTTTKPPAWATTPKPATTAPIPGFSPRCGTLNPNGINARILGFKDSETQFGEYPWMAAILETKRVQGREHNFFVCGGSLIWPNVILTAAHCVQGKKAGHLLIRLGEWDTQTTNEFYPYQDIWGHEIVIHPNYYGGALYNDIALIFLHQSAVLAPHVDTICLPGITPQYDNSSCYATGWGKNAFGLTGTYQTILREVELPLVPRAPCQTAFRGTNLGTGFNLHDSFICAGGLKNQDTCVGDGGGPLVCASTVDPWRYVLAGVVSWGVNCGTYGVPGAYVDVTKFRTWIDTTISARVANYDVTKVTVTQSLG